MYQGLSTYINRFQLSLISTHSYSLPGSLMIVIITYANLDCSSQQCPRFKNLRIYKSVSTCTINALSMILFEIIKSTIGFFLPYFSCFIIKFLGILLFVYVRASHMAKCTLISRSSVPTGFMGLAGNKGGVGIRFRFYETDICFVNCHLASGDGQTERRNEDYQTIDSRMTFTDGPTYSLKDYIWYTPTTAGSAATNAQVSTPTHWLVRI